MSVDPLVYVKWADTYSAQARLELDEARKLHYLEKAYHKYSVAFQRRKTDLHVLQKMFKLGRKLIRSSNEKFAFVCIEVLELYCSNYHLISEGACHLPE